VDRSAPWVVAPSWNGHRGRGRSITSYEPLRFPYISRTGSGLTVRSANLARARATLGDREYEEAHAEGAAMSRREALPFLGVFVYLIARGGKMHQRGAREAVDQKQAFDQYVRETAGTTQSPADELAKLADLKSKGVLTDAEFEAQKARILSS
jgi:Short C-terminal domain